MTHIAHAHTVPNKSGLLRSPSTSGLSSTAAPSVSLIEMELRGLPHVSESANAPLGTTISKAQPSMGTGRRTRRSKGVALVSISPRQHTPLSAVHVRTFFAVRNFCCIASSKVGFVRPGALHLYDREFDTPPTKEAHAHFQLYAFGSIQAVGEQHRPEVDIVVVPAVERSQAVLCQVLDPF